MAIEIAELVAEVRAHTTEFKEGMAEVEHGMSKTQKVAGLAGIAIAGGLAVGLDKSVEAAMEMQRENERMGSTFKAAGLNVDDYREEIEKAEGSGRKLGFTNLESASAITNLTLATGNAHKSLEDLSVAEDYARYKHISLQSASETLAKAMTGSGRAIKALGLQVIPATDHLDAMKSKSDYASVAQYSQAKAAAYLADKQETANMIIEKVTAATKGQADAFSHTAEGGAAQFHAQLDSLEESMGFAVLPAITKVTQALAGMAGFLAEHKGLAEILVVALGALAVGLIGVSVATWAMNSALLANPITWIVVAIAALVIGLIAAYEHFQTFRDIVNSVWDVVRNATATAVAAIVAAFNWVKSTSQAIWSAIRTDVEATWAAIEAVIRVAFGIIKTYVTGELEIIKTVISTAFNVIKDIVKIVVDLIRGDWSGAWNAMKNLVSTVMSGVEGVLRAAIGTFTSIAAQLGEALLSGLKSKLGDLLDFVKSIPGRVLAALGDLSHLLYDAGAQIVGGLIDGITSKIGAVTGAIGHLKSLIHLTDGTPAGDAEDRSFLYGAGQLVVDGLVSGITSKLSAVTGALDDVKANVAVSAPVGAPAASGGGVTVHVNNPTFLSGSRTELRQFAQSIEEFLS